MTFWNATIGNWGMPYLNTSYFNTPYINPFSPFTLPSYTNPPLGFVQPKNSVFDYNIFGFTTPYNFCYTPFLKDVNPPYNIFDSYIGTGKIFDFASNGYNPFNSNIFSKPTAPVTFSPNKQSNFLNVTNRTLSGQSPNVRKAIELAESQVGVREEGGSNDSHEIRKYKNGSKDNLPWCGSFVSWCYGRGQGTDNAKTFGYDTSTQGIRYSAERTGHYAKKSSGYKPKVGDLMIIKYPAGANGESKGGHVGIITKINNDGSFETIEGNYSNQVAKVHRSMQTAHLDGFVKMDEWLKSA